MSQANLNKDVSLYNVYGKCVTTNVQSTVHENDIQPCVTQDVHSDVFAKNTTSNVHVHGVQDVQSTVHKKMMFNHVLQ